MNFQSAGKSVMGLSSMGFAESAFYTNEFLQKEGTAKNFFDAISYPVDLSGIIFFTLTNIGLYKIQKTCYYHQGFDYAPIMIEIVDQDLKDYYNANYMMQVWNKKSEKVFEKAIKYEIKSWSAYSDHFIYKLDAQEEGSEWIYIVHLKKKNAVTKVKDFQLDDPSYVHLGIIKDLFFYANNNVIKIVDIRKDGLEDGGSIEIDVDTDDDSARLCTYQIGTQCKLHGFYENQYCKAGEERSHYIICLVETEDNQIDFARLYFWSRDVKKKDISFYQYTEVVSRDIKYDPIQKFKFIAHSTQFLFGAAIRNSGKVDIYWNCKIVQSPDEEFEDVSINFKNIYLKRKDGTILTIDTKHDIRVGTDVAEAPITMTDQEWDQIFTGSIKDTCRIFTCYVLLNTSFFVAHENIVSLFDIIKKKWIKHFFIKKEVLRVFRNEKSEKEFNLGLIVEGNGIELIDSSDTSDPEQWKQTSNSYKTSGTMKQMTEDLENYSMLYMITDDKGTPNLYGFSRTTLYIYNTLVHELKATTRVLPYFAPAERTQFILFNKDEGEVRIYTHYWANNKDQKLTFYLTIVDTPTVGKVIKFNTPSKIKGTVHTAFTPDVQKHMFLIDEKNLYRIDVKTNEVFVFENMNISSAQFIDNQYLYVLVNQSEKRPAGFYLYDILSNIENDNDTYYNLDNALVGANGTMDFSRDNQRMTYMTDYNTIQITPPQHRNVINFIGMLNRDQYIACKKIKDKFMALDKKNVITTWNVITGKLETTHKIEGYDFSEYDIYAYESMDITYKREWYQPRCLLFKKTPEDGWNDKKFYDPEMLKTSLENNTPYISIEQKKFHQFKLIEIIKQDEIKEHFSFIHPFYGIGKYQRLYVSSTMDYVLERLVNQRVLLYQRNKDSNKLTMIKRITRFPMDMSENTYANYLFSPDLMYYLDFDKQINKFVIKETLTQNVFYIIPSGLMNTEDEKAAQIAKRFKWLDSERILLANREGIEKIVDLKNNFKELSYGSISEFKNTYSDKVRHYYFHQPALKLGDTFQRLQKKQQAFKSAYYVHGMKEKYQLYDFLFDIDYSTDDSKYKYVADLSFTLLHWKLLEQLKNDQENFDINNIGPSQLKMLVYNIFPNCNTFLHQIYNKQSLIKDLYKLAEGKFDPPFIENIEGLSPLEMCMKYSEYKNADIFLQKLAKSPLDHHGRCVANIIPLAIQQGLPSVAEYIDARFIQTEQIKTLRRGCLNTYSDLDYAFTTGHFWDNLKSVEERLFIQSPVDSDIKIEYLDLPTLHCFDNQAADELFEQLSNVGVDQIELFNTKAVQLLIEYKWPIVKEFTIKKLFLPFLAYWITWFIFTNFFYEAGNSSKVPNYICMVILFPISIYVLVQEIKQMTIVGVTYFTSIWNYLDSLPPLLIIIILLFDLINLADDFDFLRTFVSLASFMLWMKLLYFLRIFPETGYLIRMIQQVVIEMRTFLMVLFIVIFAFSDAFVSLSKGLSADDNFAGDNFIESSIWTYRLALGDFQLDNVKNSGSSEYAAWIFFFASTILICIVMLNLLIAIISESFAQINSLSKQASNQERARIIAENSYLIPAHRKKMMTDQEQYLLIAQVDKDELEGDSIVNSIESMKSQVGDSNTRIESKLDAILEHLKIKDPSPSPKK